MTNPSKPNFIKKTKKSVDDVVRNSSCSHGWVRVFVQSIFATITVISFVLIIYMTMNLPQIYRPRENPPPCEALYCKAICVNAPYYGQYEEEIIATVMKVKKECDRIGLSIEDGSFEQSTLPANWLFELNADIYELTITDGNLRYIHDDAFIGNFGKNLKRLILNRLALKVLSPMMFHGLLSLERLSITRCFIEKIEDDALNLVSNTLARIEIIGTGIWNPSKLTGGSKLPSVTLINLSHNNFSSIIQKNSFTSLKYCEVLNLSHNQITVIGVGAFDSFVSIQVIYLFGNLLRTLPDGLFLNLANMFPRPKIDLLNNLWHCNCSASDLLMLTSEDMILGYPVCSSPQSVYNVSFLRFFQRCVENFKLEFVIEDQSAKTLELDIDKKNQTCYKNDIAIVHDNITVISPVTNYHCVANTIKFDDVLLITRIRNSFPGFKDWIEPKIFIQNNVISMLEIGSERSNTSYGVLWHQSSCPNEVYCINIVPTCLRVYNIDSAARYTFCPLSLATGKIERSQCIVYDLSNEIIVNVSHSELWLYACTALVFLLFGAFLIYTVIRINPSLLKGSKRVLFVKHKSINALVIPSETTLENILSDDRRTTVTQEHYSHCKNIYILPTNRQLSKDEISLRYSTRSNKSFAPSYISALEPTDDQLQEWRLKHHFSNSKSLSSIGTDLSLFTRIYDKDYSYFSLENSEIYESLK